MDRGFAVRGVMTESAQQFITPLSLSALTGEKVYTELFSLTDEAEMGHIRLARDTDLVLVAPATANFIAKLSHGLADCLASTLCLATDAPVMLAPAMNPNMWHHPATQANMDTLMSRGVHVVSPVSGDTACGEIGEGRLAEPVDIAAEAERYLRADKGCLAGRHVLITSGQPMSRLIRSVILPTGPQANRAMPLPPPVQQTGHGSRLLAGRSACQIRPM